MANESLKKKIHDAVDATDDDSVLNTVNEIMAEYKSQNSIFETWENSPEFAGRIKAAEESLEKKEAIPHEEIMKTTRLRYRI